MTLSSAPTVTVYEAPAKTVYLTGAPTITKTSYRTLSTSTTIPGVETTYVTASSISSAKGEATSMSGVHYVTTIVETAIVTFTYGATSVNSVGSLTSTDLSTSDGDLTFVVENGTTYWLDGKTPVPTKSYVTQTSVVIVQPTPVSQLTSTVTLRSTIYSTQQVTITSTVTTRSATSLASGYVGTGSSFTGVGAGGWNATSTARGFSDPGTGLSTPCTTLAVATPSSFDIYSHYSIVKSSMLSAKSGFNAYTTSVADPTTSSVTKVVSTYGPPYANTSVSTTSTSASIYGTSSSIKSTSSVRGSNSTSTAQGVFTSSASSSFQTVYSSGSTRTVSCATGTDSLVSADPTQSFWSQPTSSRSTTSYGTGYLLTNSSYTAPPSQSSTSYGSSSSVSSSKVTASSTSSTSSSHGSPTPSLCGEYGDFMLNVSIY